MENHYQYKLLDSVDSEELESIRRSEMAKRAASTKSSVATPKNAITDRELEQPVEPLINSPTRSIDITPEIVKANRAYDDTLLTVVFLCMAGMYMTLLPLKKEIID